MKTAGLILAAGESRRMGSPKALLKLGDQTFLDRLVERFSVYCSPVLVVLGHQPQIIRAGISHPEKVRFVINADYRRGQITSMQCGLREVPEDAEGVLFTLVDHPNVQLATLKQLLEDAGASVVIPRFKQCRGHPIFFSRQLVPEFLALSADSSAREVIRRHTADIRYVEVNDPGILDDIDDPRTYQRLIGELV